MAYVTGTVTSLTDLVTAIRNACTANGWALSGNVLSRNGCFAEIMLANNGESGSPPNGNVRVRSGNGIDGSNELTDAAPGHGLIGPLRVGSTYPDWDWPVAYHIHVMQDPDEVYVLINYEGGLRWQILAFGQSPSPGNAGTGNWFSAMMGRIGRSDVYRTTGSFVFNPAGSLLHGSRGRLGGPLFFFSFNGANNDWTRLGSQIHGAFDDANGGVPVWSTDANWFSGGNDQRMVSGIAGLHPLLAYQPGAANEATALVRCQILQKRPEQKTSLIGELRHVRWVRNDYIGDGEIIQLGSERWKVYPMHRRNPSVRDGQDPGDHSGTMAIAIRYDGP